jgi:hypothetical protein
MTDKRWPWRNVAEWQEDWVSRDPANRKLMGIEESQRVFDQALHQHMVQPDFSNPDEECGGFSGPPSYESNMHIDTFQQNADGSLTFTSNIDITDEPMFNLNEHKLGDGIFAGSKVIEVVSAVNATVKVVLRAAGTTEGTAYAEGHATIMKSEPPPFAEMIFTALLPRNRHDAMLGDMDERFARDCRMFGVDRARRRYWGHVLRSLRPLVVRGLKKMRAIALLEVARRYFFG